MQKLIFLFLAFTVLFSGHASGQNMILNGDFEDVNVCAEYQEACSPVAWRSSSNKLFGYNEKSTENKYATLLLYHGGRAEDRKFRAPLLTNSWIESRIKGNQTRREEGE